MSKILLEEQKEKEKKGVLPVASVLNLRLGGGRQVSCFAKRGKRKLKRVSVQGQGQGQKGSLKAMETIGKSLRKLSARFGK